MKCGFCCIYGRANAGKSSIVNRILGFKLLPVSDKPQTTRDNVHAIYNDTDSQIIFTDTPGVFKPHRRLGSILLSDAENAKEGVDVIVYVIDASEKPNLELANKLAKEQIPVIIAFNKIDLVRADVGERRLSVYTSNLPNSPVVRLSAKDNYGVDELVTEVKKHLPEEEPYYPLDIVSDRPKEFIIAEMIREKCMRLLQDEVPHSIYVDVKNVSEDDQIEVIADIIVEKDSEKAIVIGKKGKMISEISRYSEDSISAYFSLPTHVNLFVKTVPDWRNSKKYLTAFGYEE